MTRTLMLSRNLRNAAAPATALLAALALGACSSQQDSGAPGPDAKSVQGMASKGPLNGATVQLFALDAAGFASGAAITGSVITLSGGGFSINFSQAPAAPLLAKACGGSYVDESDPEPVLANKRKVTLGSTDCLESVLSLGQTTLAITPYSNALLLKARQEAGGANFLLYYESLLDQATVAYGFDVTAVLPQAPLTPDLGANSDSIDYGLMLGGSANAINAITVGVGRALPDFATIQAFIKDFSDGELDGLRFGTPLFVNSQPVPDVDLNNEIRRFRNNNFDAYGGANAPVLDEAALSAPANVPNQPPLACTPPPSGMAAWLPGDGNTFDIQTGNHGSALGSLGFNTGKVGPAFDFNGTDAVLTVPDNNFNSVTGDLTIDAWVNLRSLPAPGSFAPLVSKWNDQGGSNERSYLLEVTDAGSVFFYISMDGQPGVNGVLSSTSLPLNQFTHVAAVYDSTALTLTLYFDGVQVGQTIGTFTSIYDGAAPLLIGAGDTNGAASRLFSNALIDEVEIFNRALLPSEVQNIFNAGASGKCKPPANSDFDGDGLTHSQEMTLGTNPNNPDTDGDGLPDGAEVNTFGTSASNPDTDGDFVGDALEIEVASNPLTANAVIFVNAGASCGGTCNGLSWSTAFPNQSAVPAAVGTGAATPANQVFVLYALGTYGTLTLDNVSNVSVIGSLGAGIFKPARPATTRFDGANANRPLTLSRAFDVLVSDIEFTNGNAVIGGGVRIDNTPGISGNVALRRVAIINNQATDDGGGFAAYTGTVKIRESRISNNKVIGPSGPRGGGLVFVGNSIRIENSSISGNRADGTTGGAQGGGIAFQSTSAVMENSIIANNIVTGAVNISGGGIFSNSSSLDLQHSKILANQSSGSGGGAYVSNGTGSALILFNNLIVGNLAADAAGAGGGLFMGGSNPAITNVHSNTMAYNQAATSAGGAGGGGYFAQNGNVDFIHNIFWFNDNGTVGGTLEAGDNLADVAGGGALSYSSNNVNDISNPGGINANPLFTQGFYLTQAGNPSVNGSTIATGPGAPFTTDPSGAPDVPASSLDIGFHYQRASAGALNLVDSPNTLVCPASSTRQIEIIPRFTNAMDGDPSHIVVAKITSGIAATLTSLTTLSPQGIGSVLTKDLGNGRYEFTVSGGSVGTSTVTIYVDDQPTTTIDITYTNGC